MHNRSGNTNHIFSFQIIIIYYSQRCAVIVYTGIATIQKATIGQNTHKVGHGQNCFCVGQSNLGSSTRRTLDMDYGEYKNW